MYSIEFTSSFKKDFKRCKKRGYDLSVFEEAISILIKSGRLPAKFKAHRLAGNYADCMECHLKPDWLLIWLQDDESKAIKLIATGTHADLFKR